MTIFSRGVWASYPVNKTKLPVGGCARDNGAKEESAVVVTKLNFTYDGMDKPVLKNFDLNLPAGSR